MRERLASVTAWMNKNNIAAAFLNSTENVFYLSNFYTDPHERLMGIFVFKQAQPLFVLPAMEASQVNYPSLTTPMDCLKWGLLG